MCRSSSNFALLARCELSQVTVIISLPAEELWIRFIERATSPGTVIPQRSLNIHLVIEDLGLARFGLWDESLVQNVKDILADFLKLGLNLLTIITDGADMLVRALGFLLLFDG
jgi:hypothetical protein